MPQDSYEYWINEIMWKEKTRFSRMAESVSQRNFQITSRPMNHKLWLARRLWRSIILEIRSNDSHLVFFSWRFIKSKKRKFKKPCIVYNKLDLSCTQDSDLSIWIQVWKKNISKNERKPPPLAQSFSSRKKNEHARK